MSSLGNLRQSSLTPLKVLWGNHRAPALTRCKNAETRHALTWVENPSLRHIHNYTRLEPLRCKNIFCPSCHGEIIKKRHKGLKMNLNALSNEGYHSYLLTLTLSHTSQQPLCETLGLIKQSYALIRQGSPYTRLKEKQGLKGVMNIFEVTHGVNGFNPHCHSLVFAQDPRQAHYCSLWLSDRFERVLTKQGYAICQESTDSRLVYDGDGLANYLSKNWFNYHPINQTPFQLLKAGLAGDALMGVKFVECYEAFKRLNFAKISPSLRALIKSK